MRQLFGESAPALVMFDLDGTLVDSVPDLARAVDQMLQALGRAEAGVEQVRNWVGNGADLLVKRALAGGIDGVDRAEVSELFPAARELFMAAYAQANGRASVLYPGVLALLEHLKGGGIALAVVTNKPEAFTHPLLAQLGLADFFGAVVGGDTLAVRKPDPEPLRHLMRQFDVPPARSLMVGDSRHDVQAARGAGCPVACVRYGYNHGEPIETAAPDRVVDSLAELIG